MHDWGRARARAGCCNTDTQCATNAQVQTCHHTTCPTQAQLHPWRGPHRVADPLPQFFGPATVPRRNRSIARACARVCARANAANRKPHTRHCRRALAGYILSQLLVEQGRTKSTVHHFLLTSWKDHGVPKRDGSLFPDETLAVLDHMERVKLAHGQAAPIAVHCSAGVGRTGSLITIDHARHLLRRKGVRCAVLPCRAGV